VSARIACALLSGCALIVLLELPQTPALLWRGLRGAYAVQGAEPAPPEGDLVVADEVAQAPVRTHEEPAPAAAPAAAPAMANGADPDTGDAIDLLPTEGLAALR